MRTHQRSNVLLLGLSIFSQIAHAEMLNTNVEFSVPYNVVNGATEPFTPLVNFYGNSYLVYVDANFRPFVTQKIDNKLTTVPLDPLPDYTAFPDGHHRFSMGMDKNGYLHIAGDMHGYPYLPANYLPARYVNQTIMYWVSNQPYDVTSGFTFAGGANASTAIGGYGFNTIHFFNDNYGELYFAGMVKAYQSVTVSLIGQDAVGLYKYDAINKVWNTIGAYSGQIFPASDNVQEWKIFFWEYAGLSTGPGLAAWFQNYWPAFTFDNNNVLHFSVSGIVDTTSPSATRLLYAKSPDGGVTWYKANGTQIPGLPLRSVDSTANVADVVFDGKTTTPVTYLTPRVDVVADAHSNPLANVGIWNTDAYTWRRWDGTKWNSDISNGHQASGQRGLLGPDQKLTFIQDDTIWLRRSNGFNQYSAAYYAQKYVPLSGFNYFQCVSTLGLKTTGHFYGLGIDELVVTNTGVTTLPVIKLTFTPNDLPAGWAHQDIGSTIPLGGTADYNEGVFTIRSCGAGVLSNADQFHYVYHNLQGDGTIIARVASQDTESNYATDGIMMRETLSEDATYVALGVTVNNQLQFYYRTATGNSGIYAQQIVGAVPLWLKMTRAGNVFTIFNSTNGFAWTNMGSVSVVMAPNISVGLMAYSTLPLQQVHQAMIDNVIIE